MKNGKVGSITLQVNIGADGHVTAATITDSQIPEMNTATVAAARRYEEVWRSAESYFRTHLSEPAMFVREAAN